MSTQIMFSADAPTPMVHIVAESAMAVPGFLRTGLAHEFGHALSQARPILRRLPRWIEEGMSCWLSGEAEADREEGLAIAAIDLDFDPFSLHSALRRGLSGELGFAATHC